MSDLAERRGVDMDVYGPAEDSALLAGAVVDDLGGAGGRVLDVGTGSGYVAARIAAATDADVVGLDLNPEACRAARAAGIEAVRADLLDPVADASVDVVTFNPPYLPRVPEAEWDDWFELAVTGGETGREVIERFIDDLGRVLRPEGRAYLLVSTATGVDEVAALAADRGFHSAAIAEASFPGESLVVLRCWR